MLFVRNSHLIICGQHYDMSAKPAI